MLAVRAMPRYATARFYLAYELDVLKDELEAEKEMRRALSDVKNDSSLSFCAKQYLATHRFDGPQPHFSAGAMP